MGDYGSLEGALEPEVPRVKPISPFAVQAAANLISDAFDGVERTQPPVSRWAQRAHLRHLRMWFARRGAVATLVILSFVEKPPWCSLGDARCECTWLADAPEVCPYATFDLHYLPDKWSVVLNFACLGVLAVDYALAWRALGRGAVWRDHGTGVCLVCAGVANDVCFWVRGGDWFAARFRVAPYVALGLFVVHSEDTRSQLRLIVRILPTFSRIGALIFLLNLFFGWFGVVVFRDDAFAGEGAAFYPNLREAMWQGLILMTTANFPDIMIPAYSAHRWACSFFVTFLLLAFFFMLNLLLATVYSAYTTERAHLVEEALGARKRNLDRAFDLLATATTTHHPPHRGLFQGLDDDDDDHRDVVATKTLRAVFVALDHHPNIDRINESQAEALLANLDVSGDGNVEHEAFFDLCALLALPLEDEDEDTAVGATPASRVTRLVRSKRFEYAVDALLLLNAAVIAAQTEPALVGAAAGRQEDKTRRSSASVLEGIETAFTLLYVGEMILKMAALGRRAYFAQHRHRFDCAVTLGGIAAACYVYYPNDYSNPALIRTVMMLRLMRLARLLVALPDFQVIGESFLRMLPAASRLFKVIFAVMFFFAVLGVQIFGEKINTDPSAPQLTRLAETTYFASGYVPLNCNDLEGCYVVLFSVLVVNNWFVIVEGFEAVTNRWARLYFIAFYLVGVLICLNVVVAFIIDSFIVELEKTKKGDKRPALKRKSSSKGSDMAFRLANKP